MKLRMKEAFKVLLLLDASISPSRSNHNVFASMKPSICWTEFAMSSAVHLVSPEICQEKMNFVH